MNGMDGLETLYIAILVAIAAYVIVSKIPSILNAPLLSLATFIHSVVLIGAMIAMSQAATTTQMVIGFIAVLLAAANAIGGFSLTSKTLKTLSESKKNTGDGNA